MIVYISGCNTDIDSFWNVYSENIKKKDREDYMFYFSKKINNAEDLVRLWNDMGDMFNFESVENNFVEYFSKYVKFD